ATQNFCPGARVSDLSADGQNLRWYITPTGGTPLAVETPLEDGREYFVTQTIEGCESRSRQTVRVTVAPVPAVTATPLQEFCNAALISDLQATGTNIRWYSDQNLSVELSGNIPLQSGQTYYATQTQNSCESVPTAVQVAINAVEAPQGNTEQGFCPGATVANLTASGTNIRWYATATGGTALAPTAPLQNGITYFAEQQSGSCQSATRLAVRVSINSTDLPTAAANQTLCIGATVNELTATGQNIRWYARATETTPLPNTEQLVDGRTYFASQTIDGCESAGRRAVQVRVVNVSSPTAPQNQSFCNAATVSNLQVTGTAIRWYSDQNLTQLLTPNSPLENGRTYYTTQTQDNCESTAVAVQVSITSVAAPTGAVEQEFCNGAFVDELAVTGTAVQWFSTATGGSPLAGNLPLQDGITYYAEQTVGSCTSANRLAVRVRINTPQLPGGASQQTFCEGTPVSALQATGSNLVWYQNATGPELLNPTDIIQDGGMYYVSQRIGNCESARKEVRASIIRVQPAVAEEEQQFCESESPTVGSLFAVGDEIRWYSSPTGGQMLSDSEQLINGQTYYATNVVDGCESSERIAVLVDVRPCEVEVFNMVTRDGNAKNEYLRITNIESFPDNRLEVFNRYGVLVWATDGYGQNGNVFQGESNQSGVSQAQLGLPTGNYLYILTYKDPTKTLPVRVTGYLYLLNIQRKGL
ncbi:MAG: Ig-like domain-containing protein, partial [Mongoliitalea sp.]